MDGQRGQVTPDNEGLLSVARHRDQPVLCASCNGCFKVGKKTIDEVGAALRDKNCDHCDLITVFPDGTQTVRVGEPLAK